MSSPTVPTCRIDDLSGEGAHWGYAIPWLSRALASPLTFERMPVAPAGPDIEPATLGYWNALANLLLYSLGWARPDRGLRWWYDAGQPTDDPRLALLAEVWDRDGHLADFAAWLCANPFALPLGPLGELTGYRDDGVRTELHPTWVPWGAGAGSWFDGGTDPCHLSVHCLGPLEEADDDPSGVPLEHRVRPSCGACPRVDAWLVQVPRPARRHPSGSR